MAQSDWEKDARKCGGDMLVEALKEIKQEQEKILQRCEEISNTHKLHEADIVTLKSAFPSMDVDGHRRYHQTLIEMLEEKRKLRQAVQEKTMSGLVWLAIVGAGSAIYHEIIRILGR